MELCFSIGERLVGVSIVDVGARDSRASNFFDPDVSDRSLGTFSALVELAWCQSRGGRYHYLGLYVGACDVELQARFRPHERRVDGGGCPRRSWTEMAEKRPPCAGLWNTPMVQVNGDVTTCCLDEHLENKLGNLREQTLGEIWNGDTIESWQHK